MKRTSLEYIAEAVKGKIYARAEENRHDSVTAVSIDSRDIPAEWYPIRNGRKRWALRKM